MLAVLVIFLLSNRGPVPLGFWPFPLVMAAPLGAVVLIALLAGFLAGLAAHLPKRYGAQRRAKRAEKRVAELEARLAQTSAPKIREAVPLNQEINRQVKARA